MRAALETLEAVAQDHGSPEFWELHRDFHWALLEPGASAWIRRVLEQVWLASQRYVRLFVSETVDDAMADHRELLVCCEQRAGGRAARGAPPAPRPHRARGAPGVHARRRGRRRLARCAPRSSPRTRRRPSRASAPEPQPREGQAVVELLAAALNPADLAIASGRFPAGSPPLPYVPGIEGVGRVVQSARFAEGTRVWASGRGLGVARDGAFGERFVVGRRDAGRGSRRLPPISSPRRSGRSASPPGCRSRGSLRCAPGEVVLVLGATGSVGSVAVQVAKLLGAGRVVAVGRDQAGSRPSRALGADATVSLDGDDFQERLAAAVDGAPPTLVLDLLCGPALEAAIGRRRPGSTDRPRRAVGGADAPRSSRATCAEAAADPRLLELRRPARRARAGLRGRRRARGRRPAPPRRRGAAARSRRRGVGAAGTRPRRQARARPVTDGAAHRPSLEPMAVPVIMPKLGAYTDDVLLAQWLVGEGERGRARAASCSSSRPRRRTRRSRPRARAGSITSSPRGRRFRSARPWR